MSRVPDLVPDSDTGTAKDMVTKTIDRLTADTVAMGTITRNLLRTQKAIIKALSVSLEPVTAFRTEAVDETLLADGEVIR